MKENENPETLKCLRVFLFFLFFFYFFMERAGLNLGIVFLG